jgi:uncharacterized membrane protein
MKGRSIKMYILSKIKSKKGSSRFIELDLLRGFAIIFMIFLHLLWDLDYFGIVPLNTEIYQFQKIVPIMFFLLVGICLAITRNKYSNDISFDEKRNNRHFVIRGLKIFNLGILLTIISMFAIPDRPVFFGVLHCIGLSIIFSIPFLKLRIYNFLLSPFFILIGILFGYISIANPTVLHLAIGFHSADVWNYTIDYFPLFPWFGVTLFGIALGNLLYNGNERRYRLPEISNYRPVTMVSWLGKHALSIYLFHQPVIAGALTLYGII